MRNKESVGKKIQKIKVEGKKKDEETVGNYIIFTHTQLHHSLPNKSSAVNGRGLNEIMIGTELATVTHLILAWQCWRRAWGCSFTIVSRQRAAGTPRCGSFIRERSCEEEEEEEG